MKKNSDDDDSYTGMHYNDQEQEWNQKGDKYHQAVLAEDDKKRKKEDMNDLQNLFNVK